jgi:hypothetical protein
MPAPVVHDHVAQVLMPFELSIHVAVRVSDLVAMRTSGNGR